MKNQSIDVKRKMENHQKTKMILTVVRIGLFVFLGLFFYIKTPVFYTYENFSSLAKQISVLGLLAIGITPVFISKGFDLSVGSVAAFSLMVSGYVVLTTGNTFLAVLAGVIVGAMVGIVNALLIEGIGLNAVIVTLATMTAVRGFDIMLVKENYTTFSKKISQTDFLSIGKGVLWGVPIPFLIFSFLTLVLSIVMAKTIFGRKTYCVGYNEKAAMLNGINSHIHKGLLYLLSGAFAGLSGVVALSRIGIVTSAVAYGWEFQAVTAIIIGGTSLTGGVGTIVGSAGGVVFIGALKNLMTLNKVSGYYQDFITGFIIILAVLMDRYLNKDKRDSY